MVTEINAVDGTASRAGVIVFFAGRSGARTLEGAPPDSWWRSASTTRNEWDTRPVGAIGVDALQGVGSTPESVYMGVWTLNALTDDRTLSPPYSGRLFESDGAAVRLELPGVPANAEDVLIKWGRRSYGAHPADGDRWTLSAANPNLEMHYGRPGRRFEERGYYGLRHDYGSLSEAIFHLPSAQRRGTAFTRAASSMRFATVYFTISDAQSDVAFHLGRSPEAERTTASEFVRMLIPVVTEDGP